LRQQNYCVLEIPQTQTLRKPTFSANPTLIVAQAEAQCLREGGLRVLRYLLMPQPSPAQHAKPNAKAKAQG
jgi:hypothetical protein